MRCRECAAEVAVTARVCSRCGAPIVGQPPVVADTVVADTAVGAVSDAAVSDAAGKAVPAVAGKALREPFVPGSGARVPAQLRLVLAGYVGIACGWFAGALALALAAVFVFFFVPDPDDDPFDQWLGMTLWACVSSAVAGLGAIALIIRTGFSRLLRRPSDPRTATVTASKRGGRTLILDIPRGGTGRGYQSLSEVYLALWLKAGMLVPGETVNVYGGSGKFSDLLVSSAQRGLAFLGTVSSQSALQPRLLDEKVSGVTLVDWAAWAASTTFSSTRLGYEMQEVDAFRSAIRDTFLGVKPLIILGPPEMEREKKPLSQPPVRSDEVRGKQFSTHRPGYDKTEVDAFVEAAGLRLAAMESTDRPAGALVSGDLLFGWAEWVDSTTFVTHPEAYDMAEVDAFTERIRDTFIGASEPPVTAHNVRGKQFFTTDAEHGGYDKKQVAAFLDAAAIRLAAMESTDRPQGPLASGAILAEWAEWADATRFSTTPRLRKGYATAEVDAFRKELRDTFLGVRQPALIWDDVQRKWPGSGTHLCFSTIRGWSRPGYDMEEVDAFLKMAKLRLAAIRPLEPGSWPILRIDRPAAQLEPDPGSMAGWSPPPWTAGQESRKSGRWMIGLVLAALLVAGTIIALVINGGSSNIVSENSGDNSNTSLSSSIPGRAEDYKKLLSHLPTSERSTCRSASSLVSSELAEAQCSSGYYSLWKTDADARDWVLGSDMKRGDCLHSSRSRKSAYQDWSKNGLSGLLTCFGNRDDDVCYVEWSIMSLRITGNFTGDDGCYDYKELISKALGIRDAVK